MTLTEDYRRREESITYSAEPVGEGETHELLSINIGPHHPATHGVLRLVATLEGEVVRDIKPIIGYVHTGIEKTAEDKAYWKVIPVIERMDYVSYYFNAMAYCGAVETLLGIEVPPRAQYLRVLHLELNRIMSHLVWYGTSMLDIGALSVFFYCFRERERVLDLFEILLGTADAHALLPGRRRDRGHPARVRREGAPVLQGDADARRPVRGSAREEPDRARAAARDRDRRPAEAARARRHRAAAAGDRQSLGPAQGPSRTRATTTSTSRSRSGPSATTTTATASGTRRSTSRSRSSSRRSTGCPRARSSRPDRKVALPPRHELATSMEALIHHFKLVTEGFRVPPGEAYYPIESPRGELGCFVRSDGSAKPARVHMRDPSFHNLQALPEMVRDGYLADLIASLAMLDPILGGIDR